jgi:predicted RNA-binding protein YlxR (DUF448 family)
MTGVGSIPIRSCIGCGTHRPQAELLRLFSTADGTIDADPARRRGGRGAYLCMKVECLWEARRKNRISRALRQPMGQDELTLGMRIADRLREQILRRLHTARRAGAALPGTDAGLRPEEVRLVVLADDCEAPALPAPVVAGGPRDGLALALQAPGATFAAVLTEAMAAEISALAVARADFQRVPPPRQRGGIGRRRSMIGPEALPSGDGESYGGRESSPAAGVL